MPGVNRLSVKSKLQLLLLAASLGSIAALGYLCWQKTRVILTERITAALIDTRDARAERIEEYFQTLSDRTRTLAENPTTVTAMTEFERAFRELAGRSLSEEGDRKLTDYYAREFLPRLAKTTEGQPTLETYRPIAGAPRYLQHRYIAGNPYPAGKKQALLTAGDNSTYSEVHARYQAFFRDIVRRYGYADLFLIDAETGNIVYSTAKKTDFTTNLDNGPYRNSNLARLTRAIRDNPDRGAIQFVDFQFYRPSYNAPSAFIGTSIYEGSRRVGILAIQLPVDRIHRLLNDERKEGETYLVGEDARLRSLPRLFRENPANYRKMLRDTGVRSDINAAIDRLKTPVLLQPIETETAREALKGRSGIREIEGYRGERVLSAHAPLDIRGARWGILSEIDTATAYRPIDEFRDYLFLATAVLISLVTLYAAIAAGRFLKPIDRLNRHSRLLLNGAEPTPLAEGEGKEGDELARLKQNFNGLIAQIRDKNALILQKERENRELLVNILPSNARDRWQKGDRRIIDRSLQVTIVCVRIDGLEKIDGDRVDRALDGLNELIADLDERGNNHGLERLNCFGEQYITSCGLTRTRIDHCKRAIDFALESLDVVRTIDRKHGFSLTLAIGIHTGEVTAAVLGEREFHYDIWGEPLRLAARLQREAGSNQILVTGTVHERIADLFPFETGKAIALDGSTVPVWILGKSSLQGLIRELTFGLDLDEEES
jgi:class 3 adenylate cyclase